MQRLRVGHVVMPREGSDGDAVAILSHVGEVGSRPMSISTEGLAIRSFIAGSSE